MKRYGCILRCLSIARRGSQSDHLGPNTHETHILRGCLAATVVHLMMASTWITVVIQVAIDDDLLPDGTFVPGGTVVQFAPYAMARDEALWGPDAAEFRPQRWLDMEA